MTIKGVGTIPVYENLDLAKGIVDGGTVFDPSSAQLQLWHAQAQRDQTIISDKELAVVERLAGQTAGRSRSIYNPFTGEIRKTFLPDWIGKWQRQAVLLGQKEKG